MKVQGGLLLALALSTLATPAAGQRGGRRAQAPRDTAQARDTTWRIEEVRGRPNPVAFTTDEGTWMSVDVSPDGQRIVFDLLGDLYLLPIGGGEARRITSGRAYDAEPRFGPDGRSIAFISDRGGADNVWLADTNGANPRQVTREKETVVASPSWSADGRYLLVRKRLTRDMATTLGPWEIWMYHVEGGSGIRITDKDSIHHAAGPVASPDGRWIYFAVRPGRYQYGQEMSAGLWQIRRFDRRTGEVLPLTSGYGGAFRPQVSPNGRLLAFGRRINARTALWVRDLMTGAEQVVMDSITRDEQEGFAFNDVLPGYAWTPDGAAIVLSARGKIWRVDLERATAAMIPFTARVEQTLSGRVTVPRRLDRSPLLARNLRWPALSPDGSRIAFWGLGHVWVMPAAGGEPRRLLEDTTRFEYSPAWSPDGRWIAYTTWSDAEGGHVWRIRAEGDSPPERLTRDPGQYVNPAWSPDGSRLVVVAGSGATMRGRLLREEDWVEIRTLPASGGATELVAVTRPRGTRRLQIRPTFSRDAQRVFYPEDHGFRRTDLVSIRLDGVDRRAHLRFEWADDVIPSPDGSRVAFVERENVFVTALPEAGPQPVEIKIEGEQTSLPRRRLTREGGLYVNWLPDGSTVSWGFADALYRQRVDRDTTPVDSVRIVLRGSRRIPAGTLVLRNARIITMRGDSIIPRGDIFIERGRITGLGHAGILAPPEGSRVIDLEGATVYPGLIDVHAHLNDVAYDVYPQQLWEYLANLAYGVTTAHDVSAPSHTVFALAELVEAGALLGPRIFSTGDVIYGADASWQERIVSYDDALRTVRRLRRYGAIAVKQYQQVTRQQRQWVVEAARAESLLVTPEGGGELRRDMTMVLDGHTGLEHSIPTAPLYRDVVELMARAGTVYTPTLIVGYAGPTAEDYFYQERDVFRDPRLRRFTPWHQLDPRSRRRRMFPDHDWHYRSIAASATAILRAGGSIGLGSHGNRQGLGAHWELWAFVQGGMTPMEALRVATINGARALGLERDLGSIELGKIADLVVVNSDPLADIRATADLRYVIKEGVLYDAGTMDQIWPAARARPPFYWEHLEVRP